MNICLIPFYLFEEWLLYPENFKDLSQEYLEIIKETDTTIDTKEGVIIGLSLLFILTIDEFFNFIDKFFK